MAELPNVDWYERSREGERFGYAPGDRIGVVSGKHKGRIGHIAFVGGCRDSCQFNCDIAYVRHGGDEPKQKSLGMYWPADWDERYMLEDISHID